MSKLLHLKKFLCKILTCWMPYDKRILYREALYWFSFSDYFRFKNANYYIVSLGSNCLPRVLTTAIKLKPRRFYGEKTYPFDLCNSNLKSNIELIENDFLNFFEKIDLKDFPHDENLTQEEFIKRYQNRIKNFQEVMQSDKILYFIYSDYKGVPSKEDIQKLYKVLETKRNGKPFKLIVLTSEYIDNPDIIQFPYNFTIDHGNWLVYMINEYKSYNNKYTEYCEWIKKKLETFINY